MVKWIGKVSADVEKINRWILSQVDVMQLVEALENVSANKFDFVAAEIDDFEVGEVGEKIC
jgi:hypothetical protein